MNHSNDYDRKKNHLMKTNSVIWLLVILTASCTNEKPPNTALTVGTTDRGESVTVDETSIRKSNDRVIVTARIFSPQGTVPSDGVIMQEYVYSFNCQSRSYEKLDEKWNFDSGKVMHIGKSGKKDVIPNSAAEWVMNRGCR